MCQVPEDSRSVAIMKATDDTPAVTRTFEVTIPCPHCRRLLDVFLKEAS